MLLSVPHLLPKKVKYKRPVSLRRGGMLLTEARQSTRWQYGNREKVPRATCQLNLTNVLKPSLCTIREVGYDLVLIFSLTLPKCLIQNILLSSLSLAPLLLLHVNHGKRNFNEKIYSIDKDDFLCIFSLQETLFKCYCKIWEEMHSLNR